MEKREQGNLYRELETYRELGVPLYLNGRKSTPGRIARAYRIAEEGEYMRDYIQDEEGRIQGLAFDLVREESFYNPVQRRKNLKKT